MFATCGLYFRKKKLKLNSRVLRSGVQDGKGRGRDGEQDELGRGGKERGRGGREQVHRDRGGQHDGERHGGQGRGVQEGRGGEQHGGVRGVEDEVHGRPQPCQRRPKYRKPKKNC